MKYTQTGTMINTETSLSEPTELKALFTGLLTFKLYHFYLTSMDQRLLTLEEDLRSYLLRR